MTACIQMGLTVNTVGVTKGSSDSRIDTSPHRPTEQASNPARCPSGTWAITWLLWIDMGLDKTKGKDQ